MTKLFIAKIRSAAGTKPLVTVRAAAEGEARLFLEAAYPEDEIVDVAEPSGWASDADTGSAPGDIREHAGVEWQAPSSHAKQRANGLDRSRIRQIRTERRAGTFQSPNCVAFCW